MCPVHSRGRMCMHAYLSWVEQSTLLMVAFTERPLFWCLLLPQCLYYALLCLVDCYCKATLALLLSLSVWSTFWGCSRPSLSYSSFSTSACLQYLTLCPDLCFFLYRVCYCLININILDNSKTIYNKQNHVSTL